ncbi:MAG: hypothetical protein ACLFU8_11085 [Anaerolineales bacterium]
MRAPPRIPLPTAFLSGPASAVPSVEVQRACVAACRRRDLDRLRRLADEASAEWADHGSWTRYAITLVVVADASLDAGAPRLAQQYYRQAAQIFERRVPASQRQNEAAARYGLALVDVLFGEFEPARRHLATAQRLIRVAERHWRFEGRKRRVEGCRGIRRWFAWVAAQIVSCAPSVPESEVDLQEHLLQLVSSEPAPALPLPEDLPHTPLTEEEVLFDPCVYFVRRGRMLDYVAKRSPQIILGGDDELFAD